MIKINIILYNLIGRYKNSNVRTIKIIKNIILSFFVKGISISISFLLVPLTLSYLDTSRYGIWLTISATVGWIGFFDIGLGNGLRNKLSESLALKNILAAKYYLSTAYALLSIILTLIFLLFLFINYFLNWQVLLNTKLVSSIELNRIVILMVFLFCLQFILSLISTVLVAKQEPAFGNIFIPISNFLSLLFILFFPKLLKNNLFLICFIFSISPVIVLSISSILLYSTKLKLIKPNFKFIDFSFIKPLASLSIQFFILQSGCLVVFATDNLIISYLLGPEDVTIYNIAFRYYGIPVMIFTILISPFWSAITEAFIKHDIYWIKKSINKLYLFWIFCSLLVVALLIFSRSLIYLWVGNKVTIPLLLSIFMTIYSILSSWNGIFASFINGIGKIRLQVIYGIVSMVINIPLSILFVKYFNLGSAGVILGTSCSLLLGAILAPIQYYKIILSKAKGVWNL